MLLMLKGKKAIITGATSGIGSDIARLFAEHGADVAIFGTDSKRAALMKKELEQRKCSQEQRFEIYLVDVGQKKAVDAAISSLLESWGSIDILVNNAGITRDNLLMKMSEKEWDDVLLVNLKSAFNFSQAIIRGMLKAKSGAIISISSVVGLTGNAGQVNYAASKSGIIGFTKALAKEGASRNVRVNCIAPGFIETRMTEGLSQAQKEALLKKIPMGRMGSGRNVATAALFLASEELSGYVTGQVLTVDGGMVT